jgi:UDP-glucose 4-epimerase
MVVAFQLSKLLKLLEKVTGREIKVVESDRRAGDPPMLVGSSDKARKILGWKPQYADIQDIISHAWQWHQRRHK